MPVAVQRSFLFDCLVYLKSKLRNVALTKRVTNNGMFQAARSLNAINDMQINPA